MKLKILTAALAALLLTLQGRADLLGDTITASGITASPTTATTGAGVEFTGIDGYINFDFGANTLTVNQAIVNDLEWLNYGTYTFSGFTDTINSMSLYSNTGFDADFITDYGYTAHSIWLNMNWGTSQIDTAVFTINSSSSVPDTSATLALLGASLLGLAALRRRFVA